MSLFDSIISEAGTKFGLGNKAGSLLSALLALMTDKNRGGFAGFLDLFNNAGLGSTVLSWINSGSNTSLSNEQLESALGENTIGEIANQANVDKATTTSALAYMVPQVIDKLTPDGVVPAETDLLSRIGGYLSGLGGAALGGLGAAGAAASGAFDRVGTAAENTIDRGKAVIGDGIDSVGDSARNIGAKTTATINRVDDRIDGDSKSSILTWLLPLLLLGLAILLGYWFCGRSTTPTPANTNANVNRNVNTNVNANTAVNTTATNTNTAVTTTRTLTEVVLPSGTKLQAYPGGIEDQLIKFIQSDEYKNGTADSLKNKWFNFDDLNFEFGKTTLVPESKRQLDNIVAILKAFPDVKIKVAGYTDKKGDDAANKKLSDERAKAVQAALGKSGVGAQVPEAEGYGEEFATVAETAGDKEREADRKTSVRLIK